MASVITSDRIKKHNINKYNFKVLADAPVGGDDKEGFVKSVFTEVSSSEKSELNKDTTVDSSELTQSSKDSLIESLLQKTDEMSSNFIKLQMKLENMSDEHKIELAKVKEEAFTEGVAAGKKQALEDSEAKEKDGLSQFSTSVATLERSAKEFESALEGIKKELITAALDISKEVINIELNESSKQVATVLSNELIKELQSASKITLRVNPKDHGAISEKVGSLEHVEVVSDSAVSKGGVIAISDAGNIDAQISKRFERVKRAALSE